MESEEEKILKSAKTIAVVGLSDKPERESYAVAEYLESNGYAIIPVNPNITQWKGKKAFSSLREISEAVDVVDVFRRSESVGQIVEDALAMEKRPKAVWLQLGIRNDEAAKKARAGGMKVVQDKCMKIEHIKYSKRRGKSNS